MIDLQINGISLDLPQNPRISFSLISPVFTYELQDSTASFSFTLPASQHNREMLGYYDMTMVRNAPSSYDHATLIASGFRWDGMLTVNESRSNRLGISVRLESSLRSLIPAWKKTKLKEIDLGGVRNIAGQGPQVTRTLKPIKQVDGVLSIGINGREYSFYWSDPVPASSAIITLRDQINQQTEQTEVSATADTQNENLILEGSNPNNFNIDLNPTFNEQLWEDQNQTDPQTFIHQEILMHMNATAISALGDYDYIFAPIRAAQFYENRNPDYKGYVNLWDWDSQAFLGNSITNGEKWQNTAIPFPRIAYLLQQCLKHVGYVSRSDFILNDQGFLGACLFNNVSLDFIRTDSGAEFNGFQDTINLANHIHPDLTVAHLIEFVLRIFNLGAEIKPFSKEIDFRLKKDAWDLSRQIDWTEKTLVTSTNKRSISWGYFFSNREDDNEISPNVQAAKSQYPTFETGTGAYSIINAFPPPIQFIQGHPLDLGNSQWLLPILSYKGKTIFKDADENEVEASDYIPRIMLYRGMQQGQSGKLYPMLNNFNTDWEGANVLFDYGMNWKTSLENGFQDGIVDYFYSQHLVNAQDELVIEQELLLNARDLLEFDWFRPYRIRTEDGEAVGPIRKLNLEIDNTGIRKTTAELIRI